MDLRSGTRTESETVTRVSAVRRAPVLTFVLLVAIAWTALTFYRIVLSLDFTDWTLDFVGTEAISGVVGLLVLLLFGYLLVVLYGELSRVEPAPDPWPPRE